MSVSSVRNAVKAAVADKKVTRAEAEKLTHVAGRTGGVSPAERKELARALGSGARFAPGAREHLAATAAPAPTRATPAVKALEQLVNARGLDALSSLKDAKEDSFSPALNAGLDRFAAVLGNNDGSGLATYARELEAGAEKLVVVTDLDPETNQEHVGFFSANGEEVGRALIQKGDRELSMEWESLGGAPHQGPIATPSAHEPVKAPAGLKKALQQLVKDKNGDALGTKVSAKALPAEVRRQYAFLERTTPDGVGAERLTLKGTTVYALHDYSCVGSVHFYTADGKKVLSQID